MIRTLLALAAMAMLSMLLSGCNNEPTPEQAPPDVEQPPPVQAPSGPSPGRGE